MPTITTLQAVEMSRPTSTLNSTPPITPAIHIRSTITTFKARPNTNKTWTRSHAQRTR